LTPDEALIVSQNFSVEGGMRAAERLLQGGVAPPDAVFACNDHIAAGFIRGCREKGLRVPDDVAVVGFDDHDMCPALDPPLTSMRMPLPQVGRLCVERLIHRLEQGEAWEPEAISLPCSLVIRRSA
jgi:DNA-binding LacI/PurR family transcriptional regulator